MRDSSDPPAPGAEPPDPPIADLPGPDDIAAADDDDEDEDEDEDDEDEDDEDEALETIDGVLCVRDDGHGFGPVPLRYRHDGWVPERQLEFIEALAECGCVEQAARAVGMSRNSAYALRRRPDALAFRLAWDAATDAAVARLGDAALARAIHGVAVPVFHGGELVGERRHYDERLTMFLLRYRDPERYGRWRDRVVVSQHQNAPVAILGHRVARMLRAARAAFDAAMRGAPEPDLERECFVPAGGLHPGDEAGPADRGEPAPGPQGAAAKPRGKA